MRRVPLQPRNRKLLKILVGTINARRVLEVGCGLGYSAIWLATGLPRGGIVETIEHDETHADIARKNFRHAGVDKRVRIHLGEAGSVLSDLKGPYDFIFEDATFGERPRHYEDMLRVLRKGGYIQFQNWFPIEHAILGGASLRKWRRQFGANNYAPERTQRFVEEVRRDRRLSAVLLPHVWVGMATKLKD